jgi:ClpP class serine protease
VKQSRGARLKGPEKSLFSGEYWSGTKAIELGLADGIGDLRSTLRARFGDQVMTPLVAAERNLLGRARPGIGFDPLSHGAEFAGGIISALEARALWARYGL